MLNQTSVMTLSWLADFLRTRRPINTSQVLPTRPAQLTKQWLTAVLGDDVPDAEIVDFGFPHGDSGTTTRFALNVQWNLEGQQADLPTDLFAKTTATWRQRLALGLTGGIKGEPLFFTRFRPHIDVAAPHGYFAAFEPKSWRSITITEDVAMTRGSRFVDPLEPSDRTGIEDLLTDLAVLHGRFWCDDALTRGDLGDSYDLINGAASLINMRRRSHVGVQRARGLVPAQIVDRTDDIYDANLRTARLDRDMPFTLLHGDCHAGQRFRTNSGRTGLVDWQYLHRGHWAWDVAYAVITGLTIDDRRKWERELLEFYLNRLATAGGQPPEFELAWREYRRHAFHAYLAWVFTLGRAWYHPRWQPDEYSLAIVGRASQALVDLDALSAVPR